MYAGIQAGGRDRDVPTLASSEMFPRGSEAIGGGGWARSTVQYGAGKYLRGMFTGKCVC